MIEEKIKTLFQYLKLFDRELPTDFEPEEIDLITDKVENEDKSGILRNVSNGILFVVIFYLISLRW